MYTYCILSVGIVAIIYLIIAAVPLNKVDFLEVRQYRILEVLILSSIFGMPAIFPH